MNAIFKNESPSPVMVQILQAGGILSVVLRLKLLIFTIIKLVVLKPPLRTHTLTVLALTLFSLPDHAACMLLTQ